MAAQSCLYTAIRNTSGSQKAFSFLPPHGKTLAAGETLLFRGDLATKLAHNLRKFSAYERQLEEGNLAIINTPTVFMWDETGDRVRGLAVEDDTLGTVDPCWGEYSVSFSSETSVSSSSS